MSPVDAWDPAVQIWLDKTMERRGGDLRDALDRLGDVLALRLGAALRDAGFVWPGTERESPLTGIAFVRAGDAPLAARWLRDPLEGGADLAVRVAFFWAFFGQESESVVVVPLGRPDQTRIAHHDPIAGTTAAREFARVVGDALRAWLAAIGYAGPPPRPNPRGVRGRRGRRSGR